MAYPRSENADEVEGSLARQPEGDGMEGSVRELTTDGFFEWEDPEGEQYGIERLRRFLEQHRGSTPESIIRALHDDVRAFARGTAQMDDVTAVIIKREPPSKGTVTTDAERGNSAAGHATGPPS